MIYHERIDLVVVDGPNLFNTVASKIDEEEKLLRLYLGECLDIDLLVLSSLAPGHSRDQPIDPRIGIVIFHSRKPLGRGRYYLSSSETESFWARQGSNPNTSTLTVDIPGDQQDTVMFDCTKCGHPNETTTRAEKGIDTSIATYMMETLESWQSACLFSRDADYAPLVAALRRKGKLVYVAVPPGENATALVRVAQSAIEINLEYLRRDVAAAKYLMPAGVLDEIVGVLARDTGFTFAVDTNPEGSLSLGITHPSGAGPTLRQVVSDHLANLKLDAFTHPFRFDQRNDRLLILTLERSEFVHRKLGRFSMKAAWQQHTGNFFELHQRVVDRESQPS